MKNVLCILLIGYALVSCDQLNSNLESKSEDPNVIRAYYENGVLRSEMPIDSSKNRHGIAKRYYKSGKIQSEITYNHGKKEKAIQYYESGGAEMEFYYEDGKKHGERKKYWENGQLQSTLEYRYDDPRAGLKEYNKSGRELNKYPTLKVAHIDNLETRGEYIVEVYFSSNPGRGTYYIGELDEGYLTGMAGKLSKVNHRGRITYKPPPGTFLMEQINVIGSFKTGYGNPYIVEKTVNIAIDY